MTSRLMAPAAAVMFAAAAMAAAAISVLLTAPADLAFAAAQGLDWDSLDADRKVGLLKAGVQNPRENKTDDISDLAAWMPGVADRSRPLSNCRPPSTSSAPWG